MEDRKRKIWIIQCFLSLSIGCFVSQLNASNDVKFYESFDHTLEGSWVVSEKEDYKGVWKHAKSEGHDDYGLLVNEKAKKHAIVKEVDELINLKDDAGWTPKEFDNESPYTIMFGPDKCGATNKVHFILKHKNPKSGKYIEHHLKFPPSVHSDKLTHVYTAILKPDNELCILIDGEEKKAANFLSNDDFEPPLIPPKTIPDPDDKKPEDWDERAKIPDPDAKKSDDWDEDAPLDIEDEDVVKPEGWLDDEPEEIVDPEATRPEDWDEEENGEWEAPKIDNPKCEEALGCGEWKRPMKRNPAYKGKWHAPLVENPNYKGIWKPQLIGNPEYFEFEKPNFEPIAAIGIEIWTMQDGILFDNLLIASDEKVAQTYRETTWKPKFEAERDRMLRNLPFQMKPVFDCLYKIADLPFLGDHKTKVLDILENAEKQPNLTIGIVASIVVVIFTVLLKVIFGGKKKLAKVRSETEKTDTTETSNNQGTTEEKEDKKEDTAAAARRRNTRRDN
ncbi:unnamed protein product [Fraxinus pennsylvanica]|uniref:Calnexin n=1 Tax=Fraxinus pennsylvanica TaxID=56036 RepID=A0AAD1YPN4_9LAMI|nr:unnamed protein product [Fraxinus pennsylvanica]